MITTHTVSSSMATTTTTTMATLVATPRHHDHKNTTPLELTITLLSTLITILSLLLITSKLTTLICNSRITATTLQCRAMAPIRNLTTRRLQATWATTRTSHPISALLLIM